MGWAYRTLIRPALFAQDSEQIHQRTLRALGRVSRQEVLCDLLESLFGSPALPVELFGLKFPNPVGLGGDDNAHDRNQQEGNDESSRAHG